MTAGDESKRDPTEERADDDLDLDLDALELELDDQDPEPAGWSAPSAGASGADEASGGFGAGSTGFGSAPAEGTAEEAGAAAAASEPRFGASGDERASGGSGGAGSHDAPGSSGFPTSGGAPAAAAAGAAAAGLTSGGAAEAGQLAQAIAGVASAPADAGGGSEGQIEGQWVWQYASPPPPPPFLAVFFGGSKAREAYLFLACAVLVLVGTLLPWASEAAALPAPPAVEDPALAESLDAWRESVQSVVERTTQVPGYATPGGAVTLVIALALAWAAAAGLYTGRLSSWLILAVFLMLEPAFVTWMRLLDAMSASGDVPTSGIFEPIAVVMSTAGTGVVLALLGSTIVSVQFVFTLARVLRKKDGGGPPRRAKEKAKDKDKDKDKQEKARATSEGEGEKPKAAERAATKGKGRDADGGKAAGDDGGRSARGRRGRRR